MRPKNRAIRILPFLIIFAFLGLYGKVGNLVSGINQLNQDAFAQSNTDETSETADPASEVGNAVTAETETNPGMTGATALGDPLLMSRSELELLDDLAVRREALDQRERDMALRENLLQVTERRIDSKITRLSELETEIGELVMQYETQQNDQLDSLVKVYQTMKPKDAARIFERLDMTIQLAVATRMKETKMAPILAAMTAEKAEKLTTELAHMARLPEISRSVS